jgi:tight adherence protein B
MRVNPLATTGRGTASRPVQATRIIAVSARLFGYDPIHAEHYPLRWWLVLATALTAARVLAAMLSIFVGTWSLLAIPVAWVMLSRFVFNWSAHRRRTMLYVQFPDTLAMIVRAVRVGIPVGEGIRTVAREAAAPTGQEFALLLPKS